MARPTTLLALAFALFALVPSCSSDGATPDCPPLRVYDVNITRSREDARDQILASAAKGCITLPVGFVEGTGEGGAAGENGTAGAGGTAGENSTAGVGGTP